MPLHESGKFYPGLLDDGETWIDIFGVEHSIYFMDRDYLENVLLFLLRGARHYWRCYM